MKIVITIVILVLLLVGAAVCISGTGPIALEDDNINIVKLSFYAFRDGDWVSFADLHAPGYLQHSPGYEDPITFADYELSARIVHNRIPDLKIRIVDIFAVKNKVAVRSIWEYRSDSYRFKQRYPDGVAQGSEISIFRIEDGKIIEEWCEHDPAPVAEFCSIYKSMEHIK